MIASGLIWETLTAEQQQCVLEFHLESEKEERQVYLAELQRRRALLLNDSERAFGRDRQGN